MSVLCVPGVSSRFLHRTLLTVLGDVGESVAADDGVAAWKTWHASLGGLGRCRHAGLVVGVRTVLWDDEGCAELDEVGVGEFVDGYDVANAGLEFLGNGGEGVTLDDSVFDVAGRTAVCGLGLA